jgi:pimeloyl-ACP methyl ester carboxylesterase
MKNLIILFVISLISIFAAPAAAQHNHAPVTEARPVALEDGLGNVDHPVSTKNPEAQKFFNQGLAYLYAFNHEEAIRSFKRAAELDSDLAMAYWGTALALGSNYNLTADAAQLREAYANLQKALERAPRASEIERDYIGALTKRYAADGAESDRARRGQDYKTAMGELVKKYPDDMDAATLYAESLMNLRPWQLWSLDGQPAEGTLEIVAVLEGVLKRSPNHTGANHYYIHAVEASPTPERGYQSAARLGWLAPNAGHLVHMPSHIYIRTGDYAQAAKSNADAIVADRSYIQKTGAAGVYTLMYYNHNIHFLSAASAMNGNYAEALKQARELEANVRPHLKAMPMLEMFAPYTLVTLVRFEKWDEVMKYPEPEPELKITGGFRHFARGLALAHTGRSAEAKKELAALREKIGLVPADAGFGNSTARGVLKIAEQMLAGEIMLALGENRPAIEALRQAVAAEDVVNYNEPPDWDIPARERLGRALLVDSQFAEAEKIYRAELAKHPRNGRALFGLAEALNRQGKTDAGKMVAREFEKAWEKADTRLAVENLYRPANRAAQSSWKFGEVRLKTGIKINYAEQGDPRGAPLVLIHGFTDSWYSYSRVLPLLDKKYRVYALDLRGHGDSDRPAAGYAMKDFAADVVAFMDAMKLGKATLVGHSMGSFVALQTALDAPQRVDKLVLVGTATTARNEVTLDLQKSVGNLKDPVSEAFARDFQIATVAQKLPDEFLDGVVRQSLKLPARVWQSALAGVLAEDYGPRLGRIKTPTLIIWGDREQIFPRGEQDLLKAKIAGSVFKIYPEVGHSPHWERPEIFARDLQEFLGPAAAVGAQ